MLPFLSVGIKQLVKIDVRAYKGSVAALIEAEEPDVVFVMYNAGMCKGEKINWATHADLFDFR